MTTTVNSQPESIRAFLDAGGDLYDLDHWWILAEDVVVYRRMFGHDWVIEHAQNWVETIDHYGFDRVPTYGGGVYDEDTMIYTQRASLWELEVLADDELIDRFEAALDPEELAEDIERADTYRRPFTLAVEPPDGPWRCKITGADMTGPAVVLREREEGLLEEPLLMSPAALADVLRDAGFVA